MSDDLFSAVPRPSRVELGLETPVEPTPKTPEAKPEAKPEPKKPEAPAAEDVPDDEDQDDEDQGDEAGEDDADEGDAPTDKAPKSEKGKEKADKGEAARKSKAVDRIQELAKANKAIKAELEALKARDQERETKETAAREEQTKAQAAKEDKAIEAEIDALEEQYIEKMDNMDKKGAMALRKEINAKLQEVAERRAERKAEAAAEKRFAEARKQDAAAREQAEVMSVATELWTAHPFLDHQSDEANPAAISELIDLRDFYKQSRGMSTAAALKHASTLIVAKYGKPAMRKDSAGSEKLAKRNEDAERKKNQIAEDIPPNNGKGGKGTREESTEFSANAGLKHWLKMSPEERRRAKGLDNDD